MNTVVHEKIPMRNVPTPAVEVDINGQREALPTGWATGPGGDSQASSSWSLGTLPEHPRGQALSMWSLGPAPERPRSKTRLYAAGLPDAEPSVPLSSPAPRPKLDRPPPAVALMLTVLFMVFVASSSLAVRAML
ncbi:MAG: hypothetical protein AB1Z98_15550 [Nannocystaceae bacterium]